MFIDSSKVRGPNGKTYSRVLLRSSHRENGKVKHRTLGNLSSCSPQEIEAIRLALRHKDELSTFLAQPNPPPASPPASPPVAPETHAPAPFTQGPSVGAIAVLAALADQLGITRALGNDRSGRLALWQVIARALEQGSRLSSVRLARDLGAASILGLPSFDEDDLYENLAWLEKQQQTIEKHLFENRHAAGEPPSLFLYDVTSTYLEGQHNSLAAFGYNRDGKRGKKQIVVGLLCDETGIPLAIEAFPGNTGDTRTVANQIAKLQDRFNARHVTLVGDRGMIRGPQIQDLHRAGLHYISAISKPQIETMLASGTLQMELFDNHLAEILVPAQEDSGLPAERYILRRNPVRQAEIQASRSDRQATLQREVTRLNTYLTEHPRAKTATAIKQLEKRLTTLGLSAYLSIQHQDRQIQLQQDEAALAETSKLDGCYALRTDLSAAQADKTLVHERYKSLAHVEQAFRRSKTVELEMRPVHVRTESSTRGHLIVVMLAYQLMQELGKRWAGLDLTVAEGLARLNTYCAVEVAGAIQLLLEPRQDVQELLTAAKVTLPTVLPKSPARVSTKKKLPKNRPSRLK
jgi:transposase